MSNIRVNTINDASGGSNAVLYGVAAPANSMGFRNRIINGDMRVAQRATSATVTSGTAVPTASTGYPAMDRFFTYSTGANVTAARVAGSGATQYRLQITGAASVTAVGVGQRIEQLNSYDMAGGNAILSVDLANSVLTTVTWTASYATTADTFGTIGTPTKTQIATGNFTVNSSVTNYTAQISIPSAATTGIEILLTVGAQTSGTWTIGNMQLEAGSVASPFERRDYGRELMMCQRYFIQMNGTAANPAIGSGIQSSNIQIAGFIPLPVPMRSTPTVGAVSGTVNSTDTFAYNTAITISTQVLTANGLYLAGSIAASGAQGRPMLFVLSGTSAALGISSEL